MADEPATPTKMPWYSYLILIGHLGISAGIVLLTHGDPVPLWGRWAITGPFFALVLIFGLIDKLSKIDESKIDATPIDRWTIPHTLAGVVFASWYVPIIYVLILVFLWECFEFSVTGFGEKEVILNRVVDMGVAVGGWILTVVIIMGITDASFPFATPVNVTKTAPAPKTKPKGRQAALPYAPSTSDSSTRRPFSASDFAPAYRIAVTSRISA